MQTVNEKAIVFYRRLQSNKKNTHNKTTNILPVLLDALAVYNLHELSDKNHRLESIPTADSSVGHNPQPLRVGGVPRMSKRYLNLPVDITVAVAVAAVETELCHIHNSSQCYYHT